MSLPELQSNEMLTCRTQVKSTRSQTAPEPASLEVPARLKVFYSPQQSVLDNESYSPSAGKPELLVAQWRERYPIQLFEPTPVSPEEICLAHDPDYVRSVLQCRRPNGFSNTSPKVAASLPWTTGSLVSAARHVLAHGGAACSPTSGFHHAGYDYGRAFCTFNGLMVAALLLQDRRVAILDCDYHYGDGTDHIIRRLELQHVSHYTTGRDGGDETEAFLEKLPQVLDALQPELLLYQAGADAHLWDPEGGWMTSAQMRRRDRAVFRWCRRHEIPVVWNLAGGYQKDFQSVLDLHHATLEECLAAYSDEDA